MKILKIALIIIAILVFMFCEYRFIMHNLCIDVNGNDAYVSLFGITDCYTISK